MEILQQRSSREEKEWNVIGRRHVFFGSDWPGEVLDGIGCFMVIPWPDITWKLFIRNHYEKTHSHNNTTAGLLTVGREGTVRSILLHYITALIHYYHFNHSCSRLATSYWDGDDKEPFDNCPIFVSVVAASRPVLVSVVSVVIYC